MIYEPPGIKNDAGPGNGETNRSVPIQETAFDFPGLARAVEVARIGSDQPELLSLEDVEFLCEILVGVAALILQP